MTVVSSAMVMLIIEEKGSLELALPTILLTFILAGILLVVMGVIKIGQYIKYIPYPVVSGFMSGIGVIIIFLQIFPMFGHVSPKTIPEIVLNIFDPIRNVHLASLGLTLLTMAIIYLFPRLTKAIPSTLVALVAVTLISIITPMGVAIIGDIPKGLPMLNFSIFNAMSDLSFIVIPAITLAALGAIDSLLTSVVADNLTKTSHNSNQELIGQGIGNMVAGFIGGIPGAGATMRTLVNIRSGGKTKLSGAIHGVFLVLVLVGLGPLAEKIPLPVLAGILLTVGIGIIDRRGLAHIRKISKSDAFVLIVVLILTIFVDLLQAVAAGMIISAVIFMKQMGDITERDSTTTLSQTHREEERLHIAYKIKKELRSLVGIKVIKGPLFFGNSSYFTELGKKMSADIEVLVIDMHRVPYIDQSGLYALEEIILNMEQNGVQILLLNLQEQPEIMMKNIKIIPNLVENDWIFDDNLKLSEFIESYFAKTKSEVTNN